MLTLILFAVRKLQASRAMFFSLGHGMYCPQQPLHMHDRNGQPEADATWVFQCEPSNGVTPLQMQLRGRRLFWMDADSGKELEKTFEECCLLLESRFKDFACSCCQSQTRCTTCTRAIGFHRCEHGAGVDTWKPGTLHNGKLDVHAVLWELLRRGVPPTVLEEKIKAY